MYSFFDLSSTKGARILAGTGALIIAGLLIAPAFIPVSPTLATPETVLLTTGVLA